MQPSSMRETIGDWLGLANNEGLWPLPQPHARLISVRKVDAGGLERQNDLRNRVTVRRLVSFRARDGISMDACLLRQFPDREIEQASRCP